MKLALDKTHYQQQFLNGQFNDAQRLALTNILNEGLPNTRVEDWKYTDLTTIVNTPWILGKPTDVASSNFVIPDEPNTLVFLNGYFYPALSSKKIDAAIEWSLLKDALDITNPISKDPIETFNTAFMTDGLMLTIKANQIVKDPIHLYHLHQTAGEMSHLRHHIVAQPGSQATIIEHHVGLSDIAYFSTVVTHIHCKAHAKLWHNKLQLEGNKGYHLSQVVSELAAHSTLQQFKFDKGSRLTRTNNTVLLLEPHAHCQLAGLYVTQNQQHIDNHTLIHHGAPHTVSNEYYKGILDDRSRAVFNGRVIVEKDSQKISAQQTNKNLLLSKHAEIDTKPQLEIYADDVKCSHGATVGQLDEMALFYLQSRGIDIEIAKQALIFGFAKTVLEMIDDAPTRLSLEKMVLPSLQQEPALEDLL